MVDPPRPTDSIRHAVRSARGPLGDPSIMKRDELSFERPTELFASQPPEMRGQSRDEVRLMVTWPEGNNSHHVFTDLPTLLKQGDLLVVNESATLPASLPATSQLATSVSTSQPGSLTTSG